MANQKAQTPPVAYLKTFLFLCAVTLLNSALSQLIGYRSVGFIFLLGVLIVGFFATLGPVLFAAFLSAVSWNFLFIPPRFTLLIARPDDILLCLTYFVAALITGVLTHRIREHQAEINEKEDHLRQTEMLRESEKLHQTLLNSISHEIRTPLTAIMVSASALSDELSPDTREFRQAVSVELNAASDRLNRVIENLLDMTRLNSGMMTLKKEWNDVHDLVGVTLQRLGKNLDRHNVKAVLKSELPLIEIDFRLFEHALSNLILNAIQHAPPESSIQLLCGVEKDRLLISIEDSGRGIAEMHLDKIFEKFYRVPGTPTGGTGLGLSIVKSIVELHGGDIVAQNRTEGGARFLISLPIKDQPEGPREFDTDLSH